MPYDYNEYRSRKDKLKICIFFVTTFIGVCLSVYTLVTTYF